MRKINPNNFKMATRGLSREINRQIALTLIQTHQPISRADLSRLMDTNRANITMLVNDLLEEGVVREGSTGSGLQRGRKPTYLHLSSQQKCAVAADIRATRTSLMITDSLGNQLDSIRHFPTDRSPQKFAVELGEQIKQLLEETPKIFGCKGIGIAVPGMTNVNTGKVLHAPTLGWYQVDLVELLKQELPNIPIYIENSAKACALSQIWATRNDIDAPNDLIFVSISDGVGVGLVINGELVRGKHNTAGEFGHMVLSIDGPPCSCGANGCWEAYISNLATISRYVGRDLILQKDSDSSEILEFSINDLMNAARKNDGKALASLHLTARYLGLGLASIINAIDPSCVYIGGEITEAWDLIEMQIRNAIGERAITKELGEIDMRIVPAIEYPRLRGAVALVTAPAFAAPKVA